MNSVDAHEKTDDRRPVVTASQSRLSRLTTVELSTAAVLYAVCAAGGILLSSTPPLVSPLVPILILTSCGAVVLFVATRSVDIAFALSTCLLPLSFSCGTGAEAALLASLAFFFSRQLQQNSVWLLSLAAMICVVASGLVFVWRRHEGSPFLGLTKTINSEWAIGVLNFVVVIGFPIMVLIFIGTNLGHRNQRIAELNERAESLQRERAQQISIARGAERERIARELHDVIAHSLSVMIALSDGALASVAKEPEKSRHAVERIGETGRKTLVEVRRLLSTIREGEKVDTAQIGSRDVSQLVEEFRDAGLPISFSQVGTLPSQAAVELTVYRVVQESLTNVLRHARGVQSVRVEITAEQDQVCILVKDFSDYAAPATGVGRGIVGIEERIAFLGGVVDTGHLPDGGWRVAASFPVVDD